MEGQFGASSVDLNCTNLLTRTRDNRCGSPQSTQVRGINCTNVCLAVLHVGDSVTDITTDSRYTCPVPGLCIYLIMWHLRSVRFLVFLLLSLGSENANVPPCEKHGPRMHVKAGRYDSRSTVEGMQPWWTSPTRNRTRAYSARSAFLDQFSDTVRLFKPVLVFVDETAGRSKMTIAGLSKVT